MTDTLDPPMSPTLAAMLGEPKHPMPQRSARPAAPQPRSMMNVPGPHAYGPGDLAGMPSKEITIPSCRFNELTEETPVKEIISRAALRLVVDNSHAESISPAASVSPTEPDGAA